MDEDVTERWSQIVIALDDYIGLANSCGFSDAVLFLRMARLELMAKIHGITDAEMRAFCSVLRSRIGSTACVDSIDPSGARSN